MMGRLLFIFAFASSLLTLEAAGQSLRVILDGQLADWDTRSASHIDPIGDGTGGLDLGGLWLANDERYFFMLIELAPETLIQDDNDLVMYLDTDDDASTGIAVAGIGAELEWTFGAKAGRFHDGVLTHEIAHAPIAIVTAPTVSSEAFEIALPRDVVPLGAAPLFREGSLRVVFEDRTSGDRLPDAGGGVSYTFDPPGEALTPISLRREDPADVRFLSYNILNGGVFSGEPNQAFSRLLAAVSPDVIGLQEVRGHSVEQTRALVEAVLPSSSGEAWYAASVNSDQVLVSRFPIRDSYPIEGGGQSNANSAHLIDLGAAWGTEVLVLNAHPPCCRNDDARQLEIDHMMSFIRRAKETGGPIDLPEGSPIVVMGDMNLVGHRRQRETLVTGSIVNTNTAGPAFAPDWDETPFTDLTPRSVGLPMTFTWFREGSAFHPGRLDYIVFSDAVLEPANNFVLFTPGMSPDSLAAHGLQAEDSSVASDHLPVVGDFRYVGGDATHASPSELPRSGSSLTAVYPHPASGSAAIQIHLSEAAHVVLTAYDLLGRRVSTIVAGHRAPGLNEFAWETSALVPGRYVLVLTGTREVYTRMVVVR